MAKTTSFSKSQLQERIAVNQSNIELYSILLREEKNEQNIERYRRELAKEKRRIRNNKRRLKLYKTPISNINLSDNAIEYTLSAKSMPFKKTRITSSADSAKYIRNFYHEDLIIYESVFILLLDRSNQTIGYAKISQGGVSSTVVDTKIILKYAVNSLASGVILAHNHPSGTLRPSDPDIHITNKVKEALKYMDSTLLDHIILTENGYYSFADEGRI